MHENIIELNLEQIWVMWCDSFTELMLQGGPQS